MRTVYIMLSGTGTLFSRLLRLKLKDDYPHVSIILDDDFKSGYSFGRKKLRNPLIAGFNEERYEEWLKVFKNTKCEIYKVYISEEKYEKLINNLDKFKLNKDKYKYHLLGVIGRGFGRSIKIDNHYFCSQFVAEVMQDSGVIDLGVDPICCISSMFRTCKDLELVYRGRLKELLDGNYIYTVAECIK